MCFCTRCKPARPAAATACRWRVWREFRRQFLNQARHTLQALEDSAAASQAQVDLFAAAPELLAQGPSAVEAALAAINPDALSPREAMDALYQLKALLKD